MSNLILINQTIISSGATNVPVTNVFSSDYDIYQIQITGVFQNTNVANEITGIRLINSSDSTITSGYRYAYLNMGSDAAFAQTKNTSGTEILSGMRSDQLSDGASNYNFYIFNPFSSSSYTMLCGETASYDNVEEFTSTTGFGSYRQNTSITGFVLFESSADRQFGGGVIKTYGIRKD